MPCGAKWCAWRSEYEFARNQSSRFVRVKDWSRGRFQPLESRREIFHSENQPPVAACLSNGRPVLQPVIIHGMTVFRTGSVVQHGFSLGMVAGASQFLAELFFSLAPGFSRVNRARRKWKRFYPFSAPAAPKPLKRLGAASPVPTGLKPGANERCKKVRCAPGGAFPLVFICGWV